EQQPEDQRRAQGAGDAARLPEESDDFAPPERGRAQEQTHASSHSRCPVRAMNTSSRVGLASVTESIMPGKDSISVAMNACPSGFSIRTEPFSTTGSSPNVPAIRPPSSSA